MIIIKNKRPPLPTTWPIPERTCLHLLGCGFFSTFRFEFFSTAVSLSLPCVSLKSIERHFFSSFFFFRFFLQSHSFTKQQNFSKFGNGPTDANGIFFFLGKLPDLVAGPALRHSQTQNGTFVELELSDLHLLTCWCLAHRCRTNRQLFFFNVLASGRNKNPPIWLCKTQTDGLAQSHFCKFRSLDDGCIHSAWRDSPAKYTPNEISQSWKNSKNSCSKREISRVRKKVRVTPMRRRESQNWGHSTRKKKASHVTVCANHGPTQMNTFNAAKRLHMFKINAAH